MKEGSIRSLSKCIDLLSNSCKYGIRAVVYLASRHTKNNIGIREISKDLDLPSPFLAKIMQQLAKHKILNSVKGPNGGFSLKKKPESITMLDIVKIIDGDNLFKNCLIHDGACYDVKKSRKACPVHDDYSIIRSNIVKLFRSKTIADLARAADTSDNIVI
ncbi:MAG: Rrf2 family transcriptional regulator [Bacteroidales bacterium]|nr:Rrf2 family transcriptional regulator [Bacteroidales bacterium]